MATTDRLEAAGVHFRIMGADGRPGGGDGLGRAGIPDVEQDQRIAGDVQRGEAVELVGHESLRFRDVMTGTEAEQGACVDWLVSLRKRGARAENGFACGPGALLSQGNSMAAARP